MANLTLPRGKRGGPIIRTTDDLMDYWGERITAVAPDAEYRTQSSIIMESDVLYHYGHHFPLARIVRHANGRARIVLLNGDEWRGGSAGFGTGTWQRQSQTRAIVKRETEGTNIQHLVVPFSALDAADVIRDSIRIVDQHDERWTTQHYTSDERPGKPVQMDDPSGATYPHSEQRYGYVNAEGDVWRGNSWERPEGYSYGPYTHVVEKPVRVDSPDHSYVDDSRIPAHEWSEGDCHLESDGKWHWTTRRHWLGDALFSAQVRTIGNERTTYRRAKFLSAFDYNEPRPLYFLCELPRTSAKTIEDAIEALKPKTVLAAEAAGLEVLRQGDVFAIPTSLTTKELESRAKPASVGRLLEPVESGVTIRSRKKHGPAADALGTNHRPTHLIVTKDGDFYGRGFMYHDPSGWGRTPDHVRLKLGDGKTWYRLVKNTVPKDLGRGIVTGVNRSGSSRAWTLGGNVD
jgi:hypothetical protein